jgi:hypothetical protein
MAGVPRNDMTVNHADSIEFSRRLARLDHRGVLQELTQFGRQPTVPGPGALRAVAVAVRYLQAVEDPERLHRSREGHFNAVASGRYWRAA